VSKVLDVGRVRASGGSVITVFKEFN